MSFMAANRVDKPRRTLIGAMVTGSVAGLLWRIPSAAASEKMSPQRAEYQDTPKDIYSCAVCTLFEPPKSCKVVAGDISRDGWCKAFAMAD
jgi:hypothetical protein